MPDAKGRRKFCSGRCRKAQYATPCIDCGGRTSGSEGRRGTLCRSCAHARAVAAWSAKNKPRRERIIAAYNAGQPVKEIAAAEGLEPRILNGLLMTWRHRGEPVAYRYAAYASEGMDS